MAVGQQIKILRKHLGMSQSEFADAIGLKQGAISAIEIDRVTTLSKASMQLLVSNYNVNENWILTGNGEMFSSKPTLTIPTASGEQYWKQRFYETQIQLADLTKDRLSITASNDRVMSQNNSISTQNDSITDANKIVAESNKILAETNARAFILVETICMEILSSLRSGGILNSTGKTETHSAAPQHS